MRRLAMRVFALVTIAGAAACDGGDGLIGVPEIDGTYALRSVNGVEVPTLFYQDAFVRVDILSGRITLDDDGTFDATHSLSETQSGQTVIYSADCAGTWSLLGGIITFEEDETSQCGGVYEATLTGRTFTVDYNDEFQAVYGR